MIQGCHVWVSRGLNEGMAEWVMMTLLASYRDLPLILDAQKERRWVFDATCNYSLLKGRTMTVLGAGTIG
jgi:phosphoglycerate dehydrogenase-like enzyme